MLLHARKYNSLKIAHYIVLEFVQLATKYFSLGQYLIFGMYVVAY